MKRKMILPLLAIVFAVMSAFAVKPLSQMGYFKDGSGVSQGTIDNVNTDQHPCAVNRQVQCTISGNLAYDTPQHAVNSPATAGLLKYNP